MKDKSGGGGCRRHKIFMDSKIKNKNKGQGTGRTEEWYRLTVAREAEEAVASIAERANSGFVAGQITKSQAASWALVRQSETLSEQDIKELRALHFNEVTMLEALLKRAKETGELSAELRAVLQKQIGLPAVPKKPSKKGLQDSIINDDLRGQEI